MNLSERGIPGWGEIEGGGGGLINTWMGGWYAEVAGVDDVVVKPLGVRGAGKGAGMLP